MQSRKNEHNEQKSNSELTFPPLFTAFLFFIDDSFCCGAIHHFLCCVPNTGDVRVGSYFSHSGVTFWNFVGWFTAPWISGCVDSHSHRSSVIVALRLCVGTVSIRSVNSCIPSKNWPHTLVNIHSVHFPFY